MKSLQLRLGIGLFLSLIIVFVTLWWLTSYSLRNLAEESVAEHLEHDALGILAAISVDAGNNIMLMLNELNPFITIHFQATIFRS